MVFKFLIGNGRYIVKTPTLSQLDLSHSAMCVTPLTHRILISNIMISQCFLWHLDVFKSEIFIKSVAHTFLVNSI